MRLACTRAPHALTARAHDRACMQRMLDKYRVKDAVPAKISERDFQLGQGGVFSAFDEARMDIMLWASERGQMLSRTVKGMMMYGAALRQLELIETVDDRGGAVRLDAAVDSKFRCASTAAQRISACFCAAAHPSAETHRDGPLTQHIATQRVLRHQSVLRH
jgi:hypothetical protein